METSDDSTHPETPAVLIPAVSVVVLSGDRVLLVRRGREPSRGLYAFPGGRVESGETDEDAARREVLEETQLEVDDLTEFQTVTISGIREGIGVQYRLRVFIAHTHRGAPVAGDDADEVGWFSLGDLDACRWHARWRKLHARFSPPGVNRSGEAAFLPPCSRQNHSPQGLMARCLVLPALAIALTLAGAMPSRALDAPFEPQLLRLAEVLGSLHYLRNLCGEPGNQWRAEMEKLLTVESPDPSRRARFVASFNRGYRSFDGVYANCTASASAAISRYMKEGEALTRDIATRFGN